MKISSSLPNSLKEKDVTKKGFKYASFYAYKCRDHEYEGPFESCASIEEIDEYVKKVRIASKTVFQTIDLGKKSSSEKPAQTLSHWMPGWDLHPNTFVTNTIQFH